MGRRQLEVIEYLVEENRVLKEQVGGTRLRLTDDQRRRLSAKGKLLGRRALDRFATIVTPDTIMRWHCQLIAMKWTYQTKRVGRPGMMKSIKALIVRMANENSTWGYCRIQGELKGVGHRVASTTIANVLKENGIKPAPDRLTPWRAFLRTHWEQIAATDFFSVEVWTPVGLRTYYVLFVIELHPRRVHLAGVTPHPNNAFMIQVARSLTDAFDGFLALHRFLVCDRNGKYTDQFKRFQHDEDTEIVLTPPQAPNCNPFAERFVLSIKSECLNRMMFFGEGALRRAVASCIEHYNAKRPHQRIGNQVIDAAARVGSGRVECTKRLGGLLRSYRRAA
jgi:putative transposase